MLGKVHLNDLRRGYCFLGLRLKVRLRTARPLA
jgi:hypothetical protein